MTQQLLNKRVTFLRPFVLEGVKGVQPPGTYSIQTRTTNKGFFSSEQPEPASTSIQICESFGINGVLRNVNIDPSDLAGALRRDAEPAEAGQTA